MTLKFVYKYFSLLVFFLVLLPIMGKAQDSPRANIKEMETINKLNANFKKYAGFVKSKNSDSIKAVSKKIIVICSQGFNKDDLKISEKYYDLAAGQFLKFRDYQQLGTLLFYKGDNYLDAEFYAIALQHYELSEDYLKKSPFPCYANFPANNMGKIYFIIGDYKSARLKYSQSIQYLKQCKGVLSEASFKSEMIIRKMNISAILINEKKYQQAENDFSKLIDTPDFEKDISTYTKLLVYENLLISKSEIINPSRSKKVEDQVFRINVKTLSTDEKNIYYTVLAYIYGYKGDKIRSYSSIYSALEISELEKDQRSVVQNYYAMIFLGKKFGDVDNVKKYQQKLIDLYEELLATNAGRNVQEFTALYKLKDLEKEKQHLLEQNKLDKAVTELEKFKRKILTATTAASLFAILFIGFGLYNNRKKARALAEKNLVIEDNNRKLASLSNDLERSNRSIQKTFSIISHDLRNPFQTLLGYSSALAENYDELTADKKLSYVKTIRKAAEENYNLTQSLLEWSLKQYQGFEIKKFPEDIHNVIAQSVKSLAGFTEFKNIKIKNEVQNIIVKIDKEVIATIINNLLTNAVKFAKKDTEVLIVSQQDAASLRVTILNEDDSLTQERSEYIKTYLSSSSKEEQDYNIGFGLKIVKEMANLHNAKVEFNSERGKTEVTFVLNNDVVAI